MQESCSEICLLSMSKKVREWEVQHRNAACPKDRNGTHFGELGPARGTGMYGCSGRQLPQSSLLACLSWGPTALRSNFNLTHPNNQRPSSLFPPPPTALQPRDPPLSRINGDSPATRKLNQILLYQLPPSECRVSTSRTTTATRRSMRAAFPFPRQPAQEPPSWVVYLMAA